MAQRAGVAPPPPPSSSPFPNHLLPSFFFARVSGAQRYKKLPTIHIRNELAAWPREGPLRPASRNTAACSCNCTGKKKLAPASDSSISLPGPGEQAEMHRDCSGPSRLETPSPMIRGCKPQPAALTRRGTRNPTPWWPSSRSGEM
ncbi:hypothetical protein GQ53DRAFT_156018 [Thozetella sp. PMI_491]|nr:hypothetical protein GQ53DRAFT_156018 [Thozetella sp. PMI_491]